MIHIMTSFFGYSHIYDKNNESDLFAWLSILK